MLKKCTQLWHEAHFEVKMVKNTTDVEASLRVAGAMDMHLAKREPNERALQQFQKRWHVRGVWPGSAIAFRVAGAVQETRDSNMLYRRSGRWFPEKGCILEHQIFRFAKMILRDRCCTSYDFASLFRNKRSTLDTQTHWYEAVSSGLNFPFLTEASQNLTFAISKIEEVSQISSPWSCELSLLEEVSQNCFVSDR